MKIKIIGAGSIGNHMAFASRSLGFNTTVTDISKSSLKRMQNNIYPNRYGKWDQHIRLIDDKENDKENYDLVIIGTPPDTHYKILKKIDKNKTKAILIEKPLCKPFNLEINNFEKFAKKNKMRLFCGYNHTIGKAALKVSMLLKNKKIGKIISIDVNWREHWKGIFTAHPWLRGPADSYLGYYNRGGGALAEHSHAINLWEFFSNSQVKNKITSINANVNYIKNNRVNYDNIAFLNVKTSNNIIGRIVQDVVSLPIVKNSKILTENASIEWHCEKNKGSDEVMLKYHDKKEKKYTFHKTRADDFILELKHINKILKNKKVHESPLEIRNAIHTMKIIKAAHLSNSLKKNINLK